MIYVFLADGFEETEAVAPIDLLRRCGKEVYTVGIGDNIIKSSHNLTFVTDTYDMLVELNSDLEMIVLPGGMPGTVNLEKSEAVQASVDYCAKNNIFIGAICAAPSILGHKGLLKGRKAVCYTGYESELTGAEVLDVPAVIDGNIITARGAGVAVDFGLKLVEALVSKERSDKLREAILCP